MSGPDEHPADGVPPGADVGVPDVRSAPASAPDRRRRIPAHLGPARTSTVVLSALFVGLFALYLSVRPDPVPSTGVTVPAGGVVVTTTAPARTTAATTTPETTSPSSTATRTTTTAPGSDTSAPGSAGPTSDGGTSGATTAPRTTSAEPTTSAPTATSSPTG